MHLLLRERTSIDEDEPALDLGLAPSPVLFLSFSDSDLASVRAAGDTAVRTVALRKLRHPMSVDLFCEATVPGSGIVVARLLGGLDYWRYGADELAATCRRRGVAAVFLAGDGVDDARLAALSTVPPEARARLDAMVRFGGAENVGCALRLAHALAAGGDTGEQAATLPAAGRAEALCRLGARTEACRLGARTEARRLGARTEAHRSDARTDLCRSGASNEGCGSGGPSEGRRSEASNQNRRDDAQTVECATGACVAGRAALVLYRSHLLACDVAPHAALADALAADGFAVDAIFVDSAKSPDGDRVLRQTLRETRPDLVLNATAFSARGADGTSPLDAAGRPVLQLVLAGNGRDDWAASPRGLAPTDLAMQVVLPELDGRLATTAIGFKEEDADGQRRFAASAEGVALAARRAAGWIRLGRLAPGERRVAIVLSDYPGVGGHRHATGHAVGLDAWASLASVLGLLRAAGYALGEHELPDAAELARDLGAGRGVARRFGHVTVAVQPDRVADGHDRRASFHDPDAAPSEAYRAFYRVLAGAHDALVHLGTHGTLEWLPGKAAAPSADCAGAALSGGLPVIYPYIVSNGGEAAVARRRLGAVTIGHLTPPLVPVALDDAARAVERLLEEHAAADGLDRDRAASLRASIVARAEAAGLLAEAGATPDEDDAERLLRLDAYLCDVKALRVGDGLHVLGQPPPSRDAMLEMLGAAQADALDACAAAERDALLAALDARFVRGGPAGAPSAARADVLPTGRNLAGIDPRAVPAPSAIARARRTADLLLRRHLQEEGEPLRTLVLDLWGSAAIRTGGADLALAFLLMGVEPTHDGGSGRCNGFTVTPLAELDRPRVDVTLRVSGVFRDEFGHGIALFDQAVRRVAAREEAPEDNPLAASAIRHRVWGPAPGRYGTASETWLADSAHPYGPQLPGGPQPSGAAADGCPDPRADARALGVLVGAAQAFLHVQDHRGTDVLDGPAHEAHLGGFARAAAREGASPALWHGDITDPDAPQLRPLRDEIVRVARGRLANPDWLAGMRRHGHRGATEMARGVEALTAFAASLPDRLDASLELVAGAILADEANRLFLADANPEALAAIVAAFGRARDNGHWHPRRNDLQ